MAALTTCMERLNALLSFCNTRIFYSIFATSILMQPIALWLQAITAWRAENLDGLSAPTFIAFALLQVIGMLYGIRVKEPVILGAMFISFLASLMIITAFLVR